jgi:hypothetical protein
MKNELKILNLFLLTLLISIIGCTDKQDYKSETEPEDSELVATLNAKYGVSSIVNDFDCSNVTNLKSSNEWDFAKTTKFDFEGSDQKVIIIPALNDERFYAIKGRLSSNEFTIEKEVFCSISMDESGNGFVELLDEENNIIEYFTLIEGIPTSDKAIDSQNQLKGTQGWCQQEGNEGSHGCYKREVDEFCDGFLGCLVTATQPQVHVLIIAMCAC